MGNVDQKSIKLFYFLFLIHNGYLSDLLDVNLDEELKNRTIFMIAGTRELKNKKVAKCGPRWTHSLFFKIRRNLWAKLVYLKFYQK